MCLLWWGQYIVSDIETSPTTIAPTQKMAVPMADADDITLLQVTNFVLSFPTRCLELNCVSSKIFLLTFSRNMYNSQFSISQSAILLYIRPLHSNHLPTTASFMLSHGWLL